jgi:hypothetical protein
MRYVGIMNATDTDTPLHVRLPPALVWRVGRIAVDRGVSPSDVVRVAIVEGLIKLDQGGSVEDARAASRGERPE